MERFDNLFYTSFLRIGEGERDMLDKSFDLVSIRLTGRKRLLIRIFRYQRIELSLEEFGKIDPRPHVIDLSEIGGRMEYTKHLCQGNQMITI